LVGKKNVTSTRKAVALCSNPSSMAFIASPEALHTAACHADTAGLVFEITRPPTKRGRGWLFGSPRTTNRNSNSPVPVLHSALNVILDFDILCFCVYLLFCKL
jgi:hypothetical protein